VTTLIIANNVTSFNKFIHRLPLFGGAIVYQSRHWAAQSPLHRISGVEPMGRRRGNGRRKVGRKKRRMRAKIRHRK
jgi:hypothetical protein